MNREKTQSAQIAELKKENDELKNRIRFLESAIDNMPNPIFIKGSDGRFVLFNAEYAECFGMLKEKYIGKSVLDLDYLPEDDRQKYQKEDLHLIESGDVYSYNKEFLFSDNKEHMTYYWSKGFRCEETGAKGIVGEIVDISEERNANKMLSEIVNGAAYMFDQFFVVNLDTDSYTVIRKRDSDGNKDYDRGCYSEFYSKTEGAFYSPVNKINLDYLFQKEGLIDILKDKNDYYFECKYRLKNELTFGATIYCIERKNNLPTRVIYAIRDITKAKEAERDFQKKLKIANEKLNDLANHDGLTGLYNRRGLMEVVNQHLTNEDKAALLLIDVDKFKTINDNYGHLAGDKLLVKVADLLKASFRTGDILVRLGGDEFMAVLLGCDYDCGSFIPQKISTINERLKDLNDDIPPGTISAGIAFSRSGEMEDIYKRADKALYKAKERGRCNCCIYEDEFDN